MSVYIIMVRKQYCLLHTTYLPSVVFVFVFCLLAYLYLHMYFILVSLMNKWKRKKKARRFREHGSPTYHWPSRFTIASVQIRFLNLFRWIYWDLHLWGGPIFIFVCSVSSYNIHGKKSHQKYTSYNSVSYSQNNIEITNLRCIWEEHNWWLGLCQNLSTFILCARLDDA